MARGGKMGGPKKKSLWVVPYHVMNSIRVAMNQEKKLVNYYLMCTVSLYSLYGLFFDKLSRYDTHNKLRLKLGWSYAFYCVCCTDLA